MMDTFHRIEDTAKWHVARKKEIANGTKVFACACGPIWAEERIDGRNRDPENPLEWPADGSEDD